MGDVRSNGLNDPTALWRTVGHDAAIRRIMDDLSMSRVEAGEILDILTGRFEGDVVFKLMESEDCT